MASCSRNLNGRLLFKSETPHFFKIIPSHSIAQHKLGIPRKFIQNYGGDLSSPVILKVPSGVKWKVEIVKSDGEIWLRNGWRKFAQYYSVLEGYFLVFEYVKSNCEFNVFIFDKTATEIDYPFTLRNVDNFERPNLDHEPPQDPNVVVDEAESGVVSVEISPSKANLDQPFQNLLTCATTFSQNGEAEGNIKQPKEKESSCREPMFNDTNPTRLINVSIDKKKAESQVPEVEGTRTGILSDISRKRIEKLSLSFVRPHKIVDKETKENQSLQKKRVNWMVTSSNCQSEIPAFEVKMQASYVHHCRSNLDIPGSFATKYMKMKDGDALLGVLDGRTWSIEYYTKTRACGQTRTRLMHSGWNEFARDNHLQVGDVCKFKLIDPHKTQFRVVISRSTIGANAEPEKRREKVLSKEEKAMAVQRAVSNFRSENPSFNIVMQPSYVYTSNTLAIPSSFARKYLDKKGDAILNTLDDRSWSIKYYSSTGSGTRINNSGWCKFVKDNDLQVGDVCIFELLLEYNDLIIFRVTVAKYWNLSASPCTRKQLEEKESCSKQPKLSSDCSKRRRVGRPCNASNENYTRKKIKLHSNRDCPKEQVEEPEKQREKAMTREEKSMAVQGAVSDFLLENPSFNIVMHPSYVYASNGLAIPSSFARKYLKKKGDATFNVLDGRSWSVKYYSSISSGTRINSSGWCKFVKDNDVQVGDVCIFELLLEYINRIVFRVTISEHSNPSTSSGARKQSKEKETCSKRPNISSDYPKRKRVGRPCKISNDDHTVKKIKLQTSARTSNRDCSEGQVEGRNTKARSTFSSQNPTFQRAMQPSNFVFSTKYILRVSRKFVKNMENGSHKVKLQIENRLWSVKLNIHPYTAVFGEGWIEFARQNSLKVGDVCTFELIDKEILLIRVSISRD